MHGVSMIAITSSTQRAIEEPYARERQHGRQPQLPKLRHTKAEGDACNYTYTYTYTYNLTTEAYTAAESQCSLALRTLQSRDVAGDH